MSIKIVDEIEVCADCLQAIANNDYTALDYYYGASAAEREQEIRDGINRLADGGRSLAAVGDPAGFKWRGCECCDGDTGGARWTVAVLESVPPNQQFVISAGAVKCTYTAESEAAALESYAEDAGYSSYAELVEGHGTVDSIRQK